MAERGIKKYTEEELGKMPKDKREKILVARKERTQKLKENAARDISAETFSAESSSDREFNGKFNKIYAFVRKGLVSLHAKKTLKEVVGAHLYNATLTLLEEAKTL